MKSDWELLDNLPKASIRQLLQMSGQKLCTKCQARGLVQGPQDYLGDYIDADCSQCNGRGFVLEFGRIAK